MWMNNHFKQNDNMVMGYPLPSVVSNIFMQHFEKLALETANHKSSL